MSSQLRVTVFSRYLPSFCIWKCLMNMLSLFTHWHCYDSVNGQSNCKLFGIFFFVSALITFGKRVAIIYKYLVVWQCVLLGQIHFRGTFLLFEPVSLSICWQWLNSSGPPLTSLKLSLSPLPSYFLRASLFFHCQVPGQVRLYCECGNCPYSVQQICNLYWRLLLCLKRPCENGTLQWGKFTFCTVGQTLRHHIVL